jgi:hypothetical protein
LPERGHPALLGRRAVEKSDHGHRRPLGPRRKRYRDSATQNVAKEGSPVH